MKYFPVCFDDVTGSIWDQIAVWEIIRNIKIFNIQCQTSHCSVLHKTVLSSLLSLQWNLGFKLYHHNKKYLHLPLSFRNWFYILSIQTKYSKLYSLLSMVLNFQTLSITIHLLQSTKIQKVFLPQKIRGNLKIIIIIISLH